MTTTCPCGIDRRDCTYHKPEDDFPVFSGKPRTFTRRVGPGEYTFTLDDLVAACDEVDARLRALTETLRKP